MKFFLDENLPLSLSEIFTEFGFEVEYARTSGLRGATDREIAMYALKQKAILVTKDLEFGSLLLYPPGSHYGLIVLRVPFNFKTDQINRVMKNFIIKINAADLINTITVVEVGKYRSRKML